jgi:hypothetical protein
MDLGMRESGMLGLLGLAGLCGLGLFEALPRAFENVDEKPSVVSPGEVVGLDSGEWVKVRGRAHEPTSAVITIDGPRSAEGNLVFRLQENPAVVVCTTHERRPDLAQSHAFKGLLVRRGDEVAEEIASSWGCLSALDSGDYEPNEVHLLDGWEPTSKTMRVAWAIGLAVACVVSTVGLIALWRRRSALG